ncbi:MAG TPA: single-stranded DNA-binding protein [Candidatus Binataceae bacterium]|nr:single-stranded DNA-binding protein [Candidatus Binataceae bacterium]
MASRIELSGRVATDPELRTTPAGTSILRFEIDCSEGDNRLRIDVIVTGSESKKLATTMRRESKIRVEGSLRQVSRRLKSGIAERSYEVVASTVETENSN